MPNSIKAWRDEKAESLDSVSQAGDAATFCPNKSGFGRFWFERFLFERVLFKIVLLELYVRLSFVRTILFERLLFKQFLFKQFLFKRFCSKDVCLIKICSNDLVQQNISDDICLNSSVHQSMNVVLTPCIAQRLCILEQLHHKIIRFITLCLRNFG
jgi:hypothetical protein